MSLILGDTYEIPTIKLAESAKKRYRQAAEISLNQKRSITPIWVPQTAAKSTKLQTEPTSPSML